MSNLNNKSLEQLLQMIGHRVSELRLLKNLDQKTVAEKAGIATRSVLYLEKGHSTTVSTLLKVLKAVDALDGMELLAPKPAGKPLPLPRGPHAKERALLRYKQGKHKA